MDIGYFKSTRFDGKSFRIPDEVSFATQPGRFFIYPASVQDGSVRKFLNYLSSEERSLVEGACRHFLKEKEINNLLSSLTQSERAQKFLGLSKHSYDIKTLAAECVSETSKVYARDLQKNLTQLGYDLGAIDGKWGAKSSAAFSQYLNDRKLPQNLEVTSYIFRQMSSELRQARDNYMLSGNEQNSQVFSSPVVIKNVLPKFSAKINADSA